MLTSDIGLLGPAQITLRYEDVAHRQHAKAAKFLILGATVNLDEIQRLK